MQNMAHLGRRKNIYSITQSEKVWPVFESPYNRLWAFSHLLHSKYTLVKKWIKPQVPEDENGIPTQSSNEVLQSGFISDIAFSFDGRFLVAGSTCSDVYLFDPHTTHPEVVIRKASPDAITRVCFAGLNRFVLGSADGSLKIWDARNTKEAVCSLAGHTKVIRSINYERDKDILVTSSADDQLRYWKLSHCQEKLVQPTSTDDEVLDQPCDILLDCPSISLACMSSACKKLTFITSSGTMFVIDNLDLEHLKSDLHLLRFDNSIILQLSWITPNSALKRRNRLRVISPDDLTPNSRAKILKVSHVDFHESQPLIVVRMTTAQQMPMVTALDKKEWTCAYTLHQIDDTAALYYSNDYVKSFGSDVLEEKLLYSCEEERYNPLREKRFSFSNCGRIVASPSKKCVRLLGFSEELNMPFDWKSTQVRQSGLFSSFGSRWSASTDTFNVFSTIEMPENATICTKFSPRDYLLAVGDINDHVYFFRPVL